MSLSMALNPLLVLIQHRKKGDRPDMIKDVDWYVKHQHKQTKLTIYHAHKC